MGNLLAKSKDVVVPGEVLAEGIDYLPSFGTYRLGQNIIAGRLGITQIEGKVIKLIPLSGRYIPKRGDTIIGQVIDISFAAWRISMSSAYTGMLSLKDATAEYVNRGADLTQFFNLGDYVVAQIINVTSQKLVDLTTKGPGLRKLIGGRLIQVNTHKVPRIIGKQGSMVSMIKEYTNCKITVGQNGLIWLCGENPKLENLAVNTIKKIEEESHTSGLTERIKEFLEKGIR